MGGCVRICQTVGSSLYCRLASKVEILASEICRIWTSKSGIIAKKKRWVIDSRVSPPAILGLYELVTILSVVKDPRCDDSFQELVCFLPI